MTTDTSVSDIETRKLLYEFVRAEFDREDSRWESVDKRAAGLIPMLSIMLAIASFFGGWLLQQKMLPPISLPAWLALSCVIIAFGLIFCAWFCALNALRIRSFSIIGLTGDKLVEWFLERTTPVLYTGCAYRLARDMEDNKATVDKKNRWLVWAYYCVLASALFLVALLVLTGVHAWVGRF